MPDPEPDEFDWESIQPFVLASPRSLWPNEVQDLTPWVLGKLGELGHQLGLTLEPTGTEVPVGTFRADITAKDGMGRSVIIENQLGPSDHVHFGQVVLYALESSADVIIWLVAVESRWSGWVGLRPEHQRALERLNEVFAGKIEFYGVDVNLPPVPLLADGLGRQPLPVITVAVKPSSALPRATKVAPLPPTGTPALGRTSPAAPLRVLGWCASCAPGRLATGLLWLLAVGDYGTPIPGTSTALIGRVLKAGAACLTASVMATAASANGLRQPSTTTHSRASDPELGMRHT